MPVSLQQYRRAAGAFKSRFNHNSMHNNLFHGKPNVLFCDTYKLLYVSVGLKKFLFHCLFQKEY